MYSALIASQIGCGKTGMSFRVVTLQIIRGSLLSVSRVAFADGLLNGCLILLTIAVLSPAAAILGLFGAVTGSVLSYFLERQTGKWLSGAAGLNLAIYGVIWGPLISASPKSYAIFIIFFIVCYLVQRPIEDLFRRYSLPLLAAPALLCVWLSEYVFWVFGNAFWLAEYNLPFEGVSVGIAILLLLMVVGRTSVLLAVLCIFCATFSAMLGGATLATEQLGWARLGPVSLWAFVSVPAILGTVQFFPKFSIKAAVSCFFAALIGIVTWYAFNWAQDYIVVAPIMFPAFVGIWAVIVLISYKNAEQRNPQVVAVARDLLAKKKASSPIVVLTGAGISSSSGIPDYTAGDWLDPAVPISQYSYSNFISSIESRALYWASCERFRLLARRVLPNKAHYALRTLELSGLIGTVITQNVDGLHQRAGTANIVELHGSIKKVRCLVCDWSDEWSSFIELQGVNHICPVCAGLVKPAVVALEEDIPNEVWGAAITAVDRCGLLVVIGTQLQVSSAFELVQRARLVGASIVIINKTSLSVSLDKNDKFIQGFAEDVVPALVSLLCNAKIKNSADLILEG
jgi:NAD-dependent deacetylase